MISRCDQMPPVDKFGQNVHTTQYFSGSCHKVEVIGSDSADTELHTAQMSQWKPSLQTSKFLVAFRLALRQSVKGVPG